MQSGTRSARDWRSGFEKSGLRVRMTRVVRAGHGMRSATHGAAGRVELRRYSGRRWMW